MNDNSKLQNLLINNNKISVDAYNNMSTYQKKIFNQLTTDNSFFNNYSLNDLMFDFDTEFVQKLLDAELEYYEQECLNNGIYNKKNGSTKNIELKSSTRTYYFNRPRLRYEKDFNSVILPKRTRILNDLSDNVLLLYSKNNSINDIKDILINMFNIKVSNGFISNAIQTIHNDILSWRTRQLEKCYFALNIDCIYISIRDNKELCSHKIPIYIAVGTRLDGHKEILGMYLGNEDIKLNVIDSLYDTDISESKSFWVDIFEDLKDRGVENILYIVSDGVSGIKDAINDIFPNAFYQRCVVHIVRNLYKRIPKKEKNVINDFKKIYTANDKITAELYIKEFNEKYSDKSYFKYANKYIEEVIPLFNLPINIRKYIYTNNIVESVNSKVKRGFYGRGALPNTEAAINIIYLTLIDLEKKWKKSKVNNWNNIINEINIVHKDIIDKYLK